MTLLILVMAPTSSVPQAGMQLTLLPTPVTVNMTSPCSPTSTSLNFAPCITSMSTSLTTYGMATACKSSVVSTSSLTTYTSLQNSSCVLASECASNVHAVSTAWPCSCHNSVPQYSDLSCMSMTSSPLPSITTMNSDLVTPSATPIPSLAHSPVSDQISTTVLPSESPVHVSQESQPSSITLSPQYFH